jgi:hypothetical protein
LRQYRCGQKRLREAAGECDPTRHSKVSAILAMRDVSSITAIGLGHRLGNTCRDVTQSCREGAECTVIACDAHTVTMQRVTDCWSFYEAVDRIGTRIDGQMKRPALIVKGL